MEIRHVLLSQAPACYQHTMTGAYGCPVAVHTKRAATHVLQKGECKQLILCSACFRAKPLLLMAADKRA
jgi:hypothetical protein